MLVNALGPLSTKNIYHLLDIIHTRARSTDNGSDACQYNVKGLVPFLQQPRILLTKTSAHCTYKGLEHPRSLILFY